MKILLVLAAGIALWFLFYGLVRLVDLITMPENLRARIRMLLPGSIFVICLGYSLWALDELFGREPFYPALVVGFLTIVLLLLVWFVLRDLVAGMVFATKHPGVLGRRIEAEHVSGHVLKVGYTGLKVRTDSGQILSVPYTRIAGHVVAEQFREQSADQFRFTLQMGGEDDVEVLRERITKDTLLSPWVNHHLPLTVRILGTGTGRTAEVVFHCLNEHHAVLVEERLRQRNSALTPGR